MAGRCPDIPTGINHAKEQNNSCLCHFVGRPTCQQHRHCRGNKNHVSRTTIIYSDPDSELSLPASCETVRVSNDWFWGGKFKASLDVCEADLMLVIQGDVSCHDWGGGDGQGQAGV